MRCGLRLRCATVVLAAFIQSGCSKYIYQNKDAKLATGTIVGSVGVNGVVTFEPPPKPDVKLDRPWAREVAIPIRIVQIAPPHGCQLETSIAVSVYGTNPPSKDDYSIREVNAAIEPDARPPQRSFLSRLVPEPDQRFLRLNTLTTGPRGDFGTGAEGRTATIELVLKESYLRRVQSSDILRVQVDTVDVVSDPASERKRTDAAYALKVAQGTVKELEGQLAEMRKWQNEATARLDQQTVLVAKTLPGDPGKPASGADVDRKLSELAEQFRRKYDLDTVNRDINDTTRKLTDARADLQLKTQQAATAEAALNNPSSRAGRKTASTVRTLTLISDTQYRSDRTSKNVPIYDLTSFPLSAKQTEYLFGSKIERNFYVIGISIQNSSGELDRLINVGMIRISGLALVRPFDETDPWFSIPVQVAPQSREHVYTILDDEEVNEPRSIFFRTVEFAGTLATAFTTGFNAGEETIRALGIVTGIGIPEGKKLWPDRWPGYRRNIVNYAMPNLLKVGKNTTSPTYFLFFSKTQLQGMILDSQLFRVSVPRGQAEGSFRLRESTVESAPVNVAHLSFDSLEVPFEVIRGPLGPAGEPRILAFSEAELQREVDNAMTALEVAKSDLAQRTALLSTADSIQGRIAAAKQESVAAVKSLTEALGKLKQPDSVPAKLVAGEAQKLNSGLTRINPKSTSQVTEAEQLLDSANIISSTVPQLASEQVDSLAGIASKLHSHITDLLSAVRDSNIPAQVSLLTANVARAQDRLDRASKALKDFHEALGRPAPEPKSPSTPAKPEPPRTPPADPKPANPDSSTTG